MVLEGDALAIEQSKWEGQLYRELQPGQAKGFRIVLIPYYAWANRGPSEMSVWLPAM
jgi:hypothetical protein